MSIINKSWADAPITAKSTYIGGFAGYNAYNFHNDNIAYGNVTSTAANVGGFAGDCDDTCVFTRCQSYGNVTGTDRVGGFVGDAQERGTYKNCASYGNVKGNGTYAGGFSAFFWYADSTYINCFATGDVESNTQVGGFAGGMSGSATHTFYNSYALGTVKGKSVVGGLMGAINNTSNLYIDSAFFYADACSEDACKRGINSGLAYVPKASYYAPFSFDDNQKAITEDDLVLLDELNGSGNDWVEATCELSSGPKAKVKIPVLKDMIPTFCK